MTTPYQADYNRYWEGMTCAELMAEVRRWLGVGSADTTRYSNADVVLALNMAGERFAKLTSCLVMPVVIVVKDEAQNYRLPYNILRILNARYYTGDSRTAYDNLILISSPRAMQRFDSYYRGTLGNPKYLFPSYQAGNVTSVGVSPIPNADGTAFDGSTYGVATSATGYTNAGNLTGNHKAGYPNSAFLVDSAGRNFSTLNVKVGHMVFNTTKAETAQITAIGNAAATNDKISGTLSGAADWDEGDAFEIPMGEYGVVIDATDDSEVITISSYLGTISNIYGKSGNILMDAARKPLQLSVNFTGAVSEIPAAYQEAQIAYAVYWLGRSAYKGVAQVEKAAQALQVFGKMVDEYNAKTDVLDETEMAVVDEGWFY